MNHTELLNRFWRLDEERQFTAAETRMYLRLLDTFSRVGFDRSVTMSNTLATGTFGISLSAYKRVRQSLIDRGLITMELTTVKRRSCATFRLAEPTAKPQAEPQPEPQPQQPEATTQQPIPTTAPTKIRVKSGSACKIKVVRSRKGNETRRYLHPRQLPRASGCRD